MKPQCVNCKFFAHIPIDPEFEDAGYKLISLGHCRRYPPIPISNKFTGVRELFGVQYPIDSDTVGDSLYPGTGEHDWCGEFQLRSDLLEG